MSEELKNNEPRDAFSEKVQQKLEHYEVPVDDAIWAGIEQRLQKEHKQGKTVVLWPWLSGAAVIILLSLLVTPLFMPDNNVDDRVAVESEHKPDSIQQIDSVSNIIINNVYQEPTIQVASNVKDKNRAPLSGKTEEPQIITAQNSETINNATESTVNQPTEPTYNKEEEVPSETQENEALLALTEQQELINATEPDEQESTVQENVINEPEKPKLSEEDFERLLAEAAGSITPEDKERKRNNWQLAANIASGSGTASGTTEGDLVTANALPPLFLSPMGDYAFNNNNNKLNFNPDEFDEVNYLPALSFGLNVRKNLNKTFAMETGLLYTYLHTGFEKSIRTKQEATLDLHYLGIPLNVIVQLYNRGNWNVYVLAGGMGEKGLRSVRRQKIYVGDETYHNNLSEKIEGFQWSLNGSVGVGYRFYQNLGIYLEPRVSYFFDNDQPMSIRTKSPLSIGASIGVRYEF